MWLVYIFHVLPLLVFFVYYEKLSNWRRRTLTLYISYIGLFILIYFIDFVLCSLIDFCNEGLVVACGWSFIWINPIGAVLIILVTIVEKFHESKE